MSSLKEFKDRVIKAESAALLEGRKILWKKYFDIKQELQYYNDDYHKKRFKALETMRKAKMVEDELRKRKVPWKPGQRFNDKTIINDNGLQLFS